MVAITVSSPIASRTFDGLLASVNWVHRNSGVGNFVKDRPPAPLVSNRFFTNPHDYRFANFLHCYLTIRNGIITDYGFRPDSRIYNALSFARVPARSYSVLRKARQICCNGVEGVEFEQIAGARTLSHLAMGGLVGGVVGCLVGILAGVFVANRLMSFPPIWTQLRLRLFADGGQEVNLASHSFFPSNTLYSRAGNDEFKTISTYEAYWEQQRKWSKLGWGTNNPWHIRRPLFG